MAFNPTTAFQIGRASNLAQSLVQAMANEAEAVDRRISDLQQCRNQLLVDDDENLMADIITRWQQPAGGA